MILEIEGTHKLTKADRVSRDEIETIARAVHELNRAYCLHIGDLTMPAAGPWEDAPEEMKASLREGVICAISGATPEEMHASWLERKIKNGWQYDTMKDYDKKTHPCLLPYSALPAEQRQKDSNAIITTRVMCEALKVSYVMERRERGILVIRCPAEDGSRAIADEETTS